MGEYKKNLYYFIACIIVLGFVLLAKTNTFANWGPIENSSIIQTGEVKPIQNSDVSIEEEKLFFTFNGDYIDVKVVYTAKNNGKEGKTTFGFPIDRHNLDIDGRTSEEKKEDICDYKVFDGNKEISVLKDSEEAVVIENMFSENDMSELWLDNNEENSSELLKLNRKWKIGEIHFDSGQQKIITISYRVKASYVDGAISSSISPELSNRYFIYNLSQAKYWGDGKVKKFTMTADFRKNLNKGAKIKSINLSGCTEKEGVYTFKAENFDFSKNDHIMIVYDNYYHFNRFREHFEEVDEEFPGRYKGDNINIYNIFDVLKITELRTKDGFYGLPDYDKKIKAIHSSSSKKGNYSVKNLFDGKRETAWVEGKEGMGKGEFIELEIENFYLSVLGIINGYTKNKETYLNNGRVKKLKVDTELLLENGETQSFEKIFELEDNQDFKDLKGYEFLSLSELFPCEDINPTESKKLKMRITILDTYKGLKYEDTCISEILLIGGEEKQEDTSSSTEPIISDEEKQEDVDSSIEAVSSQEKTILEEDIKKESSSTKIIIIVLVVIIIALAALLIKQFARKR